MFMWTSMANAHSDTILRKLELGILHGLPEKYAPARFDTRSWVLEVGGNAYVFPSCFKRNLSAMSLDAHDLIFAASWNNHDTGLPDYLSITASERKIELLFNLENLRPLDWLNYISSNDPEDELKYLTRKQLCDSMLASPH